jgi:hypothetical protein
MELAHDLARFRPDDPEEVVAAALACRLCLGAAGHVDLDWDEDPPVCRCRCADCGALTVVAVDGQQAMRLALAPPEGPQVVVGLRRHA